MKKDLNKLHLQHQQPEHTTLPAHTEHRQVAREFASTEEMIRTDRNQTEVPPEVATRLNASISREPKLEAPWWKKFFRRLRV